jgi:outer membrane autotransporter protein
VGLLAESTTVTAGGRLRQPYVRANLWQDLGAPASTSCASGSRSVPLNEAATRLEFAGGLTGKINANWSLFAQASYRFSVGSANISRNDFTGDVGFPIQLVTSLSLADQLATSERFAAAIRGVFGETYRAAVGARH